MKEEKKKKKKKKKKNNLFKTLLSSKLSNYTWSLISTSTKSCRLAFIAPSAFWLAYPIAHVFHSRRLIVSKSCVTGSRLGIFSANHRFLGTRGIQSNRNPCQRGQGCQIFLGPNIPKRGKYTKWTQTLPTCHRLHQMAVKYSKWS
jgi:hypothetical protein